MITWYFVCIFMIYYWSSPWLPSSVRNLIHKETTFDATAVKNRLKNTNYRRRSFSHEFCRRLTDLFTTPMFHSMTVQSISYCWPLIILTKYASSFFLNKLQKYRLCDVQFLQDFHVCEFMGTWNFNNSSVNISNTTRCFSIVESNVQYSHPYSYVMTEETYISVSVV